VSIAVIGASGKLGTAAVGALLDRGIAPGEIVAAGRNAERLAPHAARGTRTAQIDLDDTASVAAALAGATKVLFVSVNGNARRVAQQRDAIAVAKAAGVELVVYTSFLHPDANPAHSDHAATEANLRESGVPFVVMRNASYFDFCLRRIPAFRQQGRIVGAAGDGLMGAVSRIDLADAAARLLLEPGHAGATYDLANDHPFTMGEFAAELSRQTGEQIPYVNLSYDDYVAALVAAGSEEGPAKGLANVDREIAAGRMASDSGDLRRLVGRPLVTLAEAIAGALA
jgi:NAD(P)H dehydrogenase (quinone)